MRRLSLALVGLLLLPVAAKADTFNLTATSSIFSGSAVLTTNSVNKDGSFTITGITGNGVVGLIAANDPDFGNDNLLFPTSSRIFSVAGLGLYGIFGRVNLFSTVNGYEVQGFDPQGNYFDVSASATVLRAAAITPEPSGLLLTATGLFGMAAICLRKRFASTFSL